jgi:hypothetical protein
MEPSSDNSMTMSLRRWSRAISAPWLRVLAATMLVTVPLADRTWRAAWAASYAPLGRDQGYFQYIAWALSRGEIDYRDIRDLNAPLAHVVHWAFLVLGGHDEHRFRMLDLGVSAAVFFFAGACLAEAARSGRDGTESSRGEQRFARLAWGLAGLVVLGAQYVPYGFWNLAQRESFSNWFLLPSLAICLWAQAPMPTQSRCGTRAWAIGAAGLFSALACLGKPTYVLFVAAQVLAIVAVRDAPISRPTRLVAYAAGLAVGVSLGVGFLLAFGDIRAYYEIVFHEVPAAYRYLWPQTYQAILAKPWAWHADVLAYTTTLAMSALIIAGWMPRRFFAIAVAPTFGLWSVLLQRKGFPYHFHAYSAPIVLAWLAGIAWAVDASGVRGPSRALGRAGAFALGLVGAVMLTGFSIRAMRVSPSVQYLSLAEIRDMGEKRDSREFIDHFKTLQFFPWEIRQTATYLRAATSDHDRVQIYGMDLYVLFLAGRLSATPYIDAHDLNLDASASGAQQLLDGPGTSRAVSAIEAIAEAHRRDLMKRVTSRPPAAFVFIDRAPALTLEDSFEDFRAHDPSAARWIADHYAKTASFGDIHVWLRRDRVGNAPTGDGGGPSVRNELR